MPPFSKGEYAPLQTDVQFLCYFVFRLRLVRLVCVWCVWVSCASGVRLVCVCVSCAFGVRLVRFRFVCVSWVFFCAFAFLCAFVAFVFCCFCFRSLALEIGSSDKNRHRVKIAR